MDMPETTIHMTCADSGKTLELRLTAGGDMRSAVIGDGTPDNPDAARG